MGRGAGFSGYGPFCLLAPVIRGQKEQPPCAGVERNRSGPQTGGGMRSLPSLPRPYTCSTPSYPGHRCFETPRKVLEEILLSDQRGCCCLTNELPAWADGEKKKILSAVQRLSEKFPSADSFGTEPES